MRRHLTLVVLLAVAIALVTLTASAYLVLSARMESAVNTLLSTRADAVVATLVATDGRIAMLDTPADDVLDSGVWVFDASGSPVVRASATGQLQAAVATLVARSAVPPMVIAGSTSIFGRQFVLPGHVAGMVVVSLSLLPFQQAEQGSLLAMATFDALVLLITLLGTRALLHLALRPVARLTAQARDWSEHAPERRFAMGPAGDELTALAGTLDGLLARSAAALRYEQRLTAEIAHELRTPLTRARVTTELALRRPRPPAELRSALDRVGAEIRSTTDALDALLGAAGMLGRTRGACDAVDTADIACAEARKLASVPGIALGVTPAEGLPLVGCDATHVVRALAPLLDNAVHAARSFVRVEVVALPSAEEVAFVVLDDGPGIAEAESQSLLEPGVRGTASEARDGFGLGLALATRLARAAGGRVVIVPGGQGRVELHLPAVPRAERSVV